MKITDINKQIFALQLQSAAMNYSGMSFLIHPSSKAFTQKTTKSLITIQSDSNYFHFSQDGSKIISILNNAVWAWSAEDGRELGILYYWGNAHTIEYSSDCKRLFFRSDEGICVVEINTGTKKNLLFKMEGDVSDISPDGSRIVTFAKDLIHIYDTETGVEVKKFKGIINEEKFADLKGYNNLGIQSVAFSIDGSKIISKYRISFIRNSVWRCENDIILVWDVETGRNIFFYPINYTVGSLYCSNSKIGFLSKNNVDFLPKDAFYFDIPSDTIHLLDIINGQKRRIKVENYYEHNINEEINEYERNDEEGYFDGPNFDYCEPYDCTFYNHIDINKIAVISEHKISIYDVETGLEIKKLVFENHEYPLYTKFSPDGKKLLSKSNNGKVRIWDIETGIDNYCFNKGNSDSIYKYDWSVAKGITVDLKKSALCVLRIEGVYNNDHELLPLLHKLRLPQDYEWIIPDQTENCTYILFKTNDFDCTLLDNPNISFGNNYISLRVSGSFFLPPSLKTSGEERFFIHRKIPNTSPKYVSMDSIYLLSSEHSSREDVAWLKAGNTTLHIIRKALYRSTCYYEEHYDVRARWILNDEIELLKSCHNPEAVNSLGCLYARKAFEENASRDDYINLALGCFMEASSGSDYAKKNKMAIDAFLTVESGKEISNPLERFGDFRYVYLKNRRYKYLFVDTETTGLPKKADSSYKDIDNWPRLVQISWLCVDEDGEVLAQMRKEIIPVGFSIPEETAKIHGVTTNKAINWGEDLVEVLKVFCDCAYYADCIVGHNVGYDLKVICSEIYQSRWDRIIDTHDYTGWDQYTLDHGGCEYDEHISKLPVIDTMKESLNYCKIPGYNGYKYPKLQELYRCLFGKDFENAHDSLADIKATLECFNELKRKGIISE